MNSVGPRPTTNAVKLAVRACYRRRVPVTLLLAGVVILGTGLWRDRGYTGMWPERYWAQKLNWRGCADCVLAGDSRVLMGASPAAMSAELPGRRILNFAFTSAAYTPAYLARVEEVLDPAASERTIVLGLAPRTLTRTARELSEFEPRSQRSALDTVVAAWDWTFKPLALGRAAEDLFPALRARRETGHFCVDGFVGERWVPEDPRRALPLYAMWFDQGQVEDGMASDVLDYVSRWHAEGIRVYAFRPPTTGTMVTLEDRVSGFDEPTFVARFEGAGGIWLAVDQFGYATGDGSHLCEDAALEFSRDLAAALRAHEESDRSGPPVAEHEDRPGRASAPGEALQAARAFP